MFSVSILFIFQSIFLLSVSEFAKEFPFTIWLFQNSLLNKMQFAFNVINTWKNIKRYQHSILGKNDSTDNNKLRNIKKNKCVSSCRAIKTLRNYKNYED